MSHVELPGHVQATFGLAEYEAVPLGDEWDGGWRCGEVVLSLIADHARASWSAKVRESLSVEGLRIARPVRSTDGRYVVSGWHANTYVAGLPEPRYDEVVSAANRLHDAMRKLERPRFLLQAPVAPWNDVDVFSAADRSAWDDVPLKLARSVGALEQLDPSRAKGVELIHQLAPLRKPTALESQLVHGDLFGTVLFAGTAAPGISDITPYWRPPSWAAAVVVVDALSWGGADADLITRWMDLPEWSQMLLRAVMFRLGVHVLHPKSTPEALPGLEATANAVAALV